MDQSKLNRVRYIEQICDRNNLLHTQLLASLDIFLFAQLAVSGVFRKSVEYPRAGDPFQRVVIYVSFQFLEYYDITLVSIELNIIKSSI